MASHPHQEPQHTHHELHVQPVTYQPNNTASAAHPPPAASAGQPVFDLAKFWQEEMSNAERFDSDFKNHALPLARIKKVMKTDQEVKMISAEAPILFAKGCEVFITELTKRAWVHAEENKRRTLQRSDIATAISKTDMCDFLIDIVPREEAAKSNTVYDHQTAYAGNAAPAYYPHQYAVDTATYYPQLPQFTNDQMQQYQMHLQQFAQQHHQHLPQQQDHSQQQQQPSQPQQPQQQSPYQQPQEQRSETDAKPKEQQ